jgi:NAD(P)-dependent dehydrogenase (short-subunit alcohol dehydrogenase family)
MDPLDPGHDRLPGLGEQRVVETGDEQGDAHSGTVRFRLQRCYPEAEVNDLFSVQGKTAVVTGGSRGIGLMIARGYVEGGARVYISSRKADACEQAAAELSRAGECLALPADLSSEQECLRLAGELGEREQRVHVLVNNAGATWGAPLEEYPAAAWDKLLDLNLKAPSSSPGRCCRCCGRRPPPTTRPG